MGGSEHLILMRIIIIRVDLCTMNNSVTNKYSRIEKIIITCIKYGNTQLSGITKNGNLNITINTYKDQYQKNILKHEMQDIFYIPDFQNAYKVWEFFTNKVTFTMRYMNDNIEDLQIDKKGKTNTTSKT